MNFLKNSWRYGLPILLVFTTFSIFAKGIELVDEEDEETVLDWDRVKPKEPEAPPKPDTEKYIKDQNKQDEVDKADDEEVDEDDVFFEN